MIKKCKYSKIIHLKKNNGHILRFCKSEITKPNLVFHENRKVKFSIGNNQFSLVAFIHQIVNIVENPFHVRPTHT